MVGVCVVSSVSHLAPSKRFPEILNSSTGHVRLPARGEDEDIIRRDLELLEGAPKEKNMAS